MLNWCGWLAESWMLLLQIRFVRFTQAPSVNTDASWLPWARATHCLIWYTVMRAPTWRFKKALCDFKINSRSIATVCNLKEIAVPVCGAPTLRSFIFSFKQDFSITPSRVLHYRRLQRYNRSLRLSLTMSDVYIQVILLSSEDGHRKQHRSCLNTPWAIFIHRNGSCDWKYIIYSGIHH